MIMCYEIFKNYGLENRKKSYINVTLFKISKNLVLN